MTNIRGTFTSWPSAIVFTALGGNLRNVPHSETICESGRVIRLGVGLGAICNFFLHA
uniref:Secreted protein n=1 Tax=Ascaris lumbricoides TaxID=6252 RepID=A0A0M3IV97_ASCLU